MATTNSTPDGRQALGETRGGRRRAGVATPTGLGLMLTTLLAWGAAETAPPDTAAFVQRAERLYREAGLKQAQAPADPTAAWEFARACFARAEFATNDTERAALAQQAIPVARSVVGRHPELAAGHYYLAMNLGQLARTRHLGALPLVSEMEKRLLQARALDAGLDHAGPDRCLGLLYLNAPGWPVSVGNKTKARQHLHRAVDLSPDWPDNRLNLIEALMAWDDQKTAAVQVQATALLLPAAREKLGGEEYAARWFHWNRRWKAIVEQAKPPAVPPPGPTK